MENIAACSNCSRLKKRCDEQRPCSRCVKQGVVCKVRKAGRALRPKGLRYTSKACVECKRSKTRCGRERPCRRCERMGILCHDANSIRHTGLSLQHADSSHLEVIHPYMQPTLRYPPPDMELMYSRLTESMESMSPFYIAELFVGGQDAWFLSVMGSAFSLIPKSRGIMFARKLFSIANIAGDRDLTLALQRLRYIEDPSSITSNPLNWRLIGQSPNIRLSDEELIYYYTFRHEYGVTKNFSNPPRAGVNVSIITRDQTTGRNNLTHNLNIHGETIFGHTSAQFASMAQPLDTFHSTDEFPQTLCLIHNEDIYAFTMDTFKAFMSPCKEFVCRARVVHANGTFVPCLWTQLAELYPNGSIRAVVSHFIPDMT